jgi:hypothetical protein
MYVYIYVYIYIYMYAVEKAQHRLQFVLVKRP